jgi:hypothetical protein
MISLDLGISDGSVGFRLGLLQRATPDWLLITDWPMEAAKMLAEGWDSDSLAELAGEGPRADPISTLELVDRALPELGLRVPYRDDALWCVMLIECLEATTGEISPKEAADTVTRLTSDNQNPRMRELFIEFAQGYEWDDAPEFRAQIEATWLAIATRYASQYGKSIDSVLIDATSARST